MDEVGGIKRGEEALAISLRHRLAFPIKRVTVYHGRARGKLIPLSLSLTRGRPAGLPLSVLSSDNPVAHQCDAAALILLRFAFTHF